jgi:GxxExxY protein
VLEQKYRADLVLMDKIIVELKSIDKIGSNEEAQLLNYLKATDYELGVLINFGSKEDLEWKRMMFSR